MLLSAVSRKSLLRAGFAAKITVDGARLGDGMVIRVQIAASWSVIRACDLPRFLLPAANSFARSCG
jgi:hypothetical protein